MSGFLARRLALAGLKSLRGPFGKLIKQPKLKPKRARDLMKKPKAEPLKNTKPPTIKGVNIKTKAGKEFGDKVKNQPRRIRGQKPEGMRDDLPADIDKPSILKKMNKGGALKDIPEGNKGLPKLPTEVRNKMGFKKDGGLVSATKKLKAQGLTHGGPVRGKARGMGAATKGGGYNV